MNTNELFKLIKEKYATIKDEITKGAESKEPNLTKINQLQGQAKAYFDMAMIIEKEYGNYNEELKDCIKLLEMDGFNTKKIVKDKLEELVK